MYVSCISSQCHPRLIEAICQPGRVWRDRVRMKTDGKLGRWLPPCSQALVFFDTALTGVHYYVNICYHYATLASSFSGESLP